MSSVCVCFFFFFGGGGNPIICFWKTECLVLLPEDACNKLLMIFSLKLFFSPPNFGEKSVEWVRQALEIVDIFPKMFERKNLQLTLSPHNHGSVENGYV